MKKSKFTEAQIVFALKQADQGVKVEEICRKMGVSEATYYNGKKKYGGLGITFDAFTAIPLLLIGTGTWRFCRKQN